MTQPHTIISRDVAQGQGLVYFFTGKPCSRGHISQRYTSTGGCIDCINRRRNGPRGSNVIGPDAPYVFPTGTDPVKARQALRLVQPLIPMLLRVQDDPELMAYLLTPDYLLHPQAPHKTLAELYAAGWPSDESMRAAGLLREFQLVVAFRPRPTPPPPPTE